MATIHTTAVEVERVAKKMIDRYHPDLRAVRIEYMFRNKASKRHGRSVLGTARKVTGANALLATPGAQSSEDLDLFLIVIARDWWDRADDRKREALVDHELEHCKVDIDDETGDARLVLVGHDLEAFVTEIPRHGMWRDDIEIFFESVPAEQLEFLALGITADGEVPAQSPDAPAD